MFIKVCVVCGIEFSAKTVNAKYCSRACANVARKGAKYDVKLDTKICPVCGANFTTGRIGKVYCSRRCAKAAERELMEKGEVRRRCHDCGRPTTDYRCPACWRRLRATYDNEYNFDLEPYI